MSQPAAPSFKSQIITQLIAVVVCVILPVIVTLMAPLTDLEFRSSGGGATVTIKRYVLMLIPWQTRHVENVTAIQPEVTPEFRYANNAENRRKGRANAVSHSTGQVRIAGDGPEAIVQASPELAWDIADRFEQFLASGRREPVMISVYASWSLSYLLGGAMTALAAFYVAGACLALLSLLRGTKSTSASGAE